MATDRWDELCQTVVSDDGLPVRDCGSWTGDKLYWWHRYLEITTVAMADNPAWADGLAYVDLFAGPGVCQVRDTKKRLPGSILLSAMTKKPFRKIVGVELDSSLASACRDRLDRIAPKAAKVVLEGDCNDLIDQVVDHIPPRSLTLAFIDPAGFDVHLSTLESLTSARRVDFLLLFADRMDVSRNIALYESQEESKVDRMLGDDSGWRERLKALEAPDSANVRAVFSDIFREQLKNRLGYEGVREIDIPSRQGPLYKLVYASRHPRGLEFWDKVLQKDRKGQGRWF